MRTFTSGEARKITKLPQDTLHRWSAFMPGEEAAGGGKGRHRRFTLMELFALFSGQVWRKEDAGAKRYMDIIRFLACQPEERWLSALEDGCTWVSLPCLFPRYRLPAEAGLFVKPPTVQGCEDVLRKCDLGAIWRDMQDKIEKFQRTKARNKKTKVLR